MRFDPGTIRAFRLRGYQYLVEQRRLRLHYGLDAHSFCEEILFDGAKTALTAVERANLDRCFRLAHLVAGISYYKAAVPAFIEVETGTLSPAMAAFLQQTYLHGLGEFAYCNGLDLSDRIHFPAAATTVAEACTSALEPGVVVPLGGGKDSLVTVELLRRAGCEARLISVGSSPLIGAVAAMIDWPHIRIRRCIDPALLALNDVGALNGHVPISAVLAAIMLCAAVLYGYDTVIMSNERSAEASNVRRGDGFEINHQFSKSLIFERAFQGIVAKEILPSFRYFSLLRPFSELAVTRYFADLTHYHDVFSSCNRNFRQHPTNGARWCRDCPKCRFVFLAMAPFVARARLIEIFGANLLDDPTQTEGFKALLGLRGIKPFECVGEVGECRAAFAAVVETRLGWDDDAVVVALRPFMQLSWATLTDWLKPGRAHSIPDAYREVAHALG